MKNVLGVNHIEHLKEREIEPNYLDLGFSNFEQDEINIWYYGKRLKGKNAIILSQKQILIDDTEIWKGQKRGKDEISELGIEYTGYIGNIAPTWSNQSIKKFLLNDDITVDPKALFLRIKEKLDYYMDFGEHQETISTVQACWLISTYCYPLFYWFPHLLFNGPSQSGKSKNSTICKYLGFRGYDLGASAGVTGPQIFRTLEGNRGLIVIDEYERNDTEAQKLVNQILNASANKEAYIIRPEQIDGKWIAVKFPIFCPKIVCNITGINPTSLSRFIPFHFLKTIDKVKSKRKPEKDYALNKQSFRDLTDDAHILILQNWKEIKQIAENLDLDLLNRDEDNWFAICTIAKWLGQDILDTVMKYINTYQEIQIDSSDIKADLFHLLYEKVADEDSWIMPKDIAGWCGEMLSMYKSPERWIGWRFKEYKFQKRRKGSGVYWLLSKKRIKNIIDRYFPMKTTTLNTLYTTTTTTTITTKNDDVDVVDVVDVAKKRVPYPVNKPSIYHKCFHCGTDPCIEFDKNGSPICEKCLKEKE